MKPQRRIYGKTRSRGFRSTRYFNPWAYVNMAAGEALLQRRLCLKHVPEIENVGTKIFRRLNENGQWQVTSRKDIEVSDYAKDTG